MGCYSVALPLPECSHVAKNSQDIRLEENHGLRNSPLVGEVNHIWLLAYRIVNIAYHVITVSDHEAAYPK